MSQGVSVDRETNGIGHGVTARCVTHEGVSTARRTAISATYHVVANEVTTVSDDDGATPVGATSSVLRSADMLEERDKAIDNLALAFIDALTSNRAGALVLVTLAIGRTKGVRCLHEFALLDLGDVLLVPAISSRGRHHAHGLLLTDNRQSAEALVLDYCVLSDVPRGACDLSPYPGRRGGSLGGWAAFKVDVTERTGLRTNLFRTLSYVTSEARQGAIDISEGIAVGCFAAPWREWLASGGVRLFRGTRPARPCANTRCCAHVRGRRATCSDKCRQHVRRHPDEDGRRIKPRSESPVTSRRMDISNGRNADEKGRTR